MPLFVWGLGVPGIKFYNEPIVAMTYENENLIQTVLLVQPAVTIVINLLCGFLADRLGREKIVYGGILASCLSLGIFVIIAKCRINAPVLMGAMWGIMVGAYFSVTNILLLMVMEMAQKNRIGRFSAMAAYANAAGTTIGMVVISIVSKVSDTSVSKLVMLILAAIVSVILVRKIKL